MMKILFYIKVIAIILWLFTYYSVLRVDKIYEENQILKMSLSRLGSCGWIEWRQNGTLRADLCNGKITEGKRPVLRYHSSILETQQSKEIRFKIRMRPDEYEQMQRFIMPAEYERYRAFKNKTQ